MIRFKPDDPPMLDEKLPDLTETPLTPTKLKNKIVKKAGEIANWLLKIIKHRFKNNTKIVDWILDTIDKKKSQKINIG